ncbi:hypothetical protein BASA81_011155 [Batrachochytrium salamandrivorans]|nr:hypothetical protein BASA81_011155 [Batrachochytrium salamandrivorans]
MSSEGKGYETARRRRASDMLRDRPTSSSPRAATVATALSRLTSSPSPRSKSDDFASFTRWAGDSVELRTPSPPTLARTMSTSSATSSRTITPSSSPPSFSPPPSSPRLAQQHQPVFLPEEYTFRGCGNRRFEEERSFPCAVWAPPNHTYAEELRLKQEAKVECELRELNHKVAKMDSELREMKQLLRRLLQRKDE